MTQKDSFTRYRELIRDKLLFCIRELGKDAQDPAMRNAEVERVLLDVIEDTKELKSTAELETDKKVKIIPRCFGSRMRTMRHQICHYIDVLQQGERWVLYVIVCLELTRVYIGRTTLCNDVKNDPSAAEVDNKWSLVMEQQLQSDYVKQLVQNAVDSMDNSVTATFEEYYGDLQTVWNILNEPVATCNCRQCSLRRGFHVRFLQ